MSDTTIPTGIRVFTDDERTPLVLGPEAVEGWTEETRQVEATALVMLLDPADYDAAIEDAGALLEDERYAPAAVAILERFAIGGKPKAAQKILDWLGPEGIAALEAQEAREASKS